MGVHIAVDGGDVFFWGDSVGGDGGGGDACSRWIFVSFFVLFV